MYTGKFQNSVILWCLKLAVCIGVHSYAVTGVWLISIEVKCLHSSEDLGPRHVENPLLQFLKLMYLKLFSYFQKYSGDVVFLEKDFSAFMESFLRKGRSHFPVIITFLWIIFSIYVCQKK